MLLLVFTASTVNAQKTQTKAKGKTTKQAGSLQYQCPMKCEGEKMYAKAGKCAVCNMNLKAVAKEATVFACPMKCEEEKTYAKAGKCPVCNMSLKEVKKEATAYQCPMKCEGDKTYLKDGKCPVCNMNLKQQSSKNKTKPATGHEGHNHN